MDQKQNINSRILPTHFYEDKTFVGTVSNMKNVNSEIWDIFKTISRTFGSEGAALAYCISEAVKNPLIADMIDKQRSYESKRIDEEVSKCQK